MCRAQDASPEPLPKDTAAPMQIAEPQRRHTPDGADVQASPDQQERVDGSETADVLAKSKQQTVITSASIAEEQTAASGQLEVSSSDEGLQAMQTDAQ